MGGKAFGSPRIGGQGGAPGAIETILTAWLSSYLLPLKGAVLASPVGELRVRPGAFDFFPHLRTQAVALNTWEGEKYRLDLAQVFPGRYTTASPRVTRLLPLFVSVGQRLATHITPLTAGQAPERAIPALGWLGQPAFPGNRAAPRAHPVGAPPRVCTRSRLGARRARGEHLWSDYIRRVSGLENHV